MARLKYRRIDTRTEKGLRQAERLHARGWRIISGSLFISGSVLMESPKGDR